MRAGTVNFAAVFRPTPPTTKMFFTAVRTRLNRNPLKRHIPASRFPCTPRLTASFAASASYPTPPIPSVPPCLERVFQGWLPLAPAPASSHARLNPDHRHIFKPATSRRAAVQRGYRSQPPLLLPLLPSSLPRCRLAPASTMPPPSPAGER